MRRTSRAARFGGVVVATATAAALATAQDRGAAEGDGGPPDLGTLPQTIARWQDAVTSAQPFEVSDLQSLALAVESDDLVFQAELHRPVAGGMFSCVDLEFDCDGRRADVELETRASVGSRYRPNGFVPRAGEAAPLRLVRASWLSPFNERNPADPERGGMTNIGPMSEPQVGGTALRFRVPKQRLASRGSKGATTPPAFRAKLVTTCADHPLAFDYDAAGRGRDIRVDGDGDDWSGGPYVEDAGGELHEAVRRMDLRAVWCEHAADRLFLRVDFDAPGFGTALSDGDVSVLDTLHVEVQPRGDAYMEDTGATISAQQATGKVGGVSWLAHGSVVEISVARDPKQSKFRVAVWSEAKRVDALAGDWLELPGAALR